jgi:hypothetical protein
MNNTVLIEKRRKKLFESNQGNQNMKIVEKKSNFFSDETRQDPIDNFNPDTFTTLLDSRLMPNTPWDGLTMNHDLLMIIPKYEK